jgi:toxin ParE1/3/4
MSTSRRRAAKVVYTKAAERDLQCIARYTLEVWGPERRERYLAMLEQTCEHILPEHRRFGREVEERPGILRWRAESHVIFVREVEGGLEIVRILHERQLASRHL